jgi:AcrR family transcriptional regulator
MKRKRLRHADRRESILAAATGAFASDGFGGARTQQIARAAGVSEALLFRHFPTKQALYDAVHERLIAIQDANFEVMTLPAASTEGLVSMLWATLRACVYGRPGSQATAAQRLMLLSLAGDGEHAREFYGRANRKGLRALAAALEAARAAGDLEGEPIEARNAFALIGYVATMLTSVQLTGKSVVPMTASKDRLLRDAVHFCGRGLGLSEGALARYAPAERPRSEALDAVVLLRVK